MSVKLYRGYGCNSDDNDKPKTTDGETGTHRQIDKHTDTLAGRHDD